MPSRYPGHAVLLAARSQFGGTSSWAGIMTPRQCVCAPGHVATRAPGKAGNGLCRSSGGATVLSWLGAVLLMKQGCTRWKLYLVGLLFLHGAAGCQVLPDKGTSCPADQVVGTGLQPAAATARRSPILAPSSAHRGSARNLGTHGYYYRPSEKDGIAYTCRGGHIDVAHLRIAADWTAYLASQTYRHLMKHDAGFSYKLAVDRSRDYVQFSYPADWDSLPEAQRRSGSPRRSPWRSGLT